MYLQGIMIDILPRTDTITSADGHTPVSSLSHGHPPGILINVGQPHEYGIPVVLFYRFEPHTPYTIHYTLYTLSFYYYTTLILNPDSFSSSSSPIV